MEKETKRSLSQLFASSALEFKSTRNLVLCALLGALSLVLRMVASIDVGPYIRIGFSEIPARVCDMLFGPVVGMIFGGAMDIINYMMKPTGPFFFGFTASAIVAGLICGTVYYKKKITLKRVLIAQGILAVVVNMGMNTAWLVLLYGKSLSAILPMRVLKELIMWPINSLIFFAVVTAIERTGVFAKFRRGVAI